MPPMASPSRKPTMAGSAGASPCLIPLPYKVFGEGDYFPMPFEVRLQPAPDRTSLRIMVEYGACDPQGLCSPEEADLTC